MIILSVSSWSMPVTQLQKFIYSELLTAKLSPLLYIYSLQESKRELHTNRPPHSNSFNKNDPKRTSIGLSSLETKALDEENKPNDNNLVSAGSSSDDAADTSLHSSVHDDKKCTHDCKAEIPPAHQLPFSNERRPFDNSVESLDPTIDVEL